MSQALVPMYMWQERESAPPKQLLGFYAFFQHIMHVPLLKVVSLNKRNATVSQFSSFRFHM